MQSEYYDQYQVQSALQREGGETQMAAYAPAMHEQLQQAQAVLVQETNPKKVIKDVILLLQGLQENPDGTKVRIALPKMNRMGISAMSFILNAHINQNIILSHLDNPEIKKLMEIIQNDLVDDLTLNWKEYGVMNKSDLDIINNAVLVNIYIALKRAEGQNEKNWLGKISVENISSAPRISGQKKDGFWSKFKL